MTDIIKLAALVVLFMCCLVLYQMAKAMAEQIKKERDEEREKRNGN